jgi:hypothetical protein
VWGFTTAHGREAASAQCLAGFADTGEPVSRHGDSETSRAGALAPCYRATADSEACVVMTTRYPHRIGRAV